MGTIRSAIQVSPIFLTYEKFVIYREWAATDCISNTVSFFDNLVEWLVVLVSSVVSPVAKQVNSEC